MKRLFIAAGIMLAAACSPAAAVDDVLPFATPDAAVEAGPREELDFDVLRRRACTPEVASHETEPRAHVPRDFEVPYKTNPPSSGLHYATWAEYASHPSPLDPREYVHNLEHGAIVFLYKCASAEACPSTAAALKKVSDALPDDAFCAASGSSVRVRTVIAPAPDLDVPVAAVAWGVTYKATCFDEASLQTFARTHYGLGPEANCAEGGAGAAMNSR